MRRAGLFLSALYSKMDEKDIIFDLDAGKVDFIGYNLKGKRLVNRGEAGNWMGGYAGSVVNFGSGGDGMGGYADLILEAGKSRSVGWVKEGAVVVCLNEVKIWNDGGKVITPRQCGEMRELVEYVERIRGISQDREKLIEFLKTEDGDIGKDVRRILRDSC